MKMKLEYALERVTDVLRGMDAAAEKAAQRLDGYERIFVNGAGRSGLMLKAFAMRLAQMGKTVYCVGETVTPAIEKGDLLVVASASGNTAGVCHNAQIAARAGADIFLITASEASTLAALHAPDVLLHAPTKDDACAGDVLMGTLFEQALLLFCDAVIAHLPHDGERMRKRHANLE